MITVHLQRMHFLCSISYEFLWHVNQLPLSLDHNFQQTSRLHCLEDGRLYYYFSILHLIIILKLNVYLFITTFIVTCHLFTKKMKFTFSQMCKNFNSESFIQDNFDISTKTSREKQSFAPQKLLNFIYYLFINYYFKTSTEKPYQKGNFQGWSFSCQKQVQPHV